MTSLSGSKRVPKRWCVHTDRIAKDQGHNPGRRRRRTNPGPSVRPVPVHVHNATVSVRMARAAPVAACQLRRDSAPRPLAEARGTTRARANTYRPAAAAPTQTRHVQTRGNRASSYRRNTRLAPALAQAQTADHSRHLRYTGTP